MMFNVLEHNAKVLKLLLISLIIKHQFDSEEKEKSFAV